MNEIIKNIYGRRAVRKYKDIPVSREHIDEIIAAGKMAPSAMNKQPWKFYVLSDWEKIKFFSGEIEHFAVKEMMHAANDADKTALSSFHLSSTMRADTKDEQDHIFHGAPVAIFITAPKADEWGAIDVGMCAQNMMLAARSLGFDTCPIGFAKFIMQTTDYSELKIPSSDVVYLAVIVGYADEKPIAHERVENNVFYH